jgi:hypothetical protein
MIDQWPNLVLVPTPITPVPPMFHFSATGRPVAAERSGDGWRGSAFGR